MSMQHVLAVGAFALALSASVFAVVGPTYSSSSTSSVTAAGQTTSQTVSTSRTGLQVNGRWILVLAGIPVLITLLPLVGGRRRVTTGVAAVMLGAFCVVTSMSIGIFYVPALLVLLTSFLIRNPARSPGHSEAALA